MSHYSIEKYNPEWVTKFQSIRAMLESVFGARALAIEHVGSTSVPGIKAKPIIDILVVVESIDTFQNQRDEMLSRGYQIQENYIAPDTILFRKVDEHGNKLENIHVCESDTPMEKQFLVMRDYLRTFPEEAKCYSDFKDELVRKFPDDYESYRKAKDPFLQDLKQKAYDWNERIK